jgi:hypothetical protein
LEMRLDCFHLADALHEGQLSNEVIVNLSSTLESHTWRLPRRAHSNLCTACNLAETLGGVGHVRFACMEERTLRARVLYRNVVEMMKSVDGWQLVAAENVSLPRVPARSKRKRETEKATGYVYKAVSQQVRGHGCRR